MILLLGSYRTWIHFVVTILCITVCLNADQKCSRRDPGGFVIYEFNCSMEDIPFTAYYIKGTNCSDHLLEQQFPYLYHRPDDLFPGKPKDFKVLPFQDVHPANQKVYSGGDITITTPVTASVIATKGFEVEFHPVSDFSISKVRCFVFQFHRNLTAQDTKKDVSFRVFPLIGEGFYFEAYSLPKPPPSEDMYLYWFLSTTYGYNNLSSSSADWVTTISYYNDTNNQQISFSFVAAPQKFNFTEYNIELWRNNETNAARIEKISTLHYTFDNLTPGTYVVMVQPHDPYWQDNRMCLCKDNQNQCLHCVVTKSAKMEIYSKLPTLPTTSTQTMTDNKPLSTGHSLDTVSSTPTNQPPIQQPGRTTQWPGEADEVSQETVMAAVFGVIAGIALVTVLAFLLHQRKRKKKDPQVYNVRHDNNHNFTKDAEIFNNLGLDVSSEAVNNQYRELPKKRIFFVYAEDHIAHVEVIKAFAKFLNDHCRCELIFAPWSTYDVNQDKIRWISRSFDRADFTVIINSVSAHHQFKAGKKLRSNHDSPLADLYYPTINHIHHKVVMSSDYGRLINVCFEYTKQEFFIEDICAGAQYVLLKHLQEFLCHIHGINQQTTRMSDVGLAFVENISVLPEGEKLQMAIRNAFAYEKSHPNWFEQDVFDSGVDSVENLPIEDREAIKRDYESNFNRSPDSISKIMEHPSGPIWNIPLNLQHPSIEPSMAYTVTAGSNNFGDDQTFVAPSVCTDLDVSSNHIQDQIEAVNSKYAEDSRHIYLRQESKPFDRYDKDAEQIYPQQDSSPDDRFSLDTGQIYLHQDSTHYDKYLEDTHFGQIYLRQDSTPSGRYLEDIGQTYLQQDSTPNDRYSEDTGQIYHRQDSTPNDRYDENETVSLGGQSV